MNAKLQTLFFNDDRKLRNGWWILIFIGFIALTRFVYKPVTHGLKDLGLAELWLEPASFLFTLLATWGCTLLRKQPLSSVGYQLNLRWLGQLVSGTGIGVAMILVVVGLIWCVNGVQIELNPTRSIEALATGFYIFLCAALLEENLYRGFIFQRLVDGCGIWIAQIGLALLFALGHWDNPGMEGATKFVASLDLFLGAIMFGLAYLRTRSLALPVGLHVGWNWAQGNLLGFGVSGHQQTGWFQPLLQDHPQWLNGGEFGPEASLFSPLISLMVILWLWRWRKTTTVTSDSTPLSATEPAL